MHSVLPSVNEDLNLDKMPAHVGQRTFCGFVRGGLACTVTTSGELMPHQSE